jgi:tetratricopeptide (TPR) repeat protein
MISSSFVRALLARTFAVIVGFSAFSTPGSGQVAGGLSQNTPALRASTGDMHPASRPVVNPPLSRELRGDIFMARKRFREALDMYRDCQPSAVVANKMGIAFQQLQLLPQAKRDYQAAIKMDPKYPQATNNLGTVYYGERSYRKAIKTYKKALKLDPQSASIWVNLGSAYFSKRDFKRASDSYDTAMRLDPDVFEHRSSYGTLLEERNMDERAKFHLYLAKAYARRGDNEKAIQCLRKAFEEGLKERKKVPDMPEFASLKSDAAFKDLIVQNPKPL